jgi:hypothetical protein
MPKAKFPKLPMPKIDGPLNKGNGSMRGGKKGGGDGSSLMGPGGRGGSNSGRGGMKGQRAGKGKVAPGEHPNGSWETKSGILGDFTYNASDGKTYYGQEAMDKYEEDHPGEGGPHDGLTGESGMYWGDSSFHPSQQSDQQEPATAGRWGG